jgi:hypothetical protein
MTDSGIIAKTDVKNIPPKANKVLLKVIANFTFKKYLLGD